MLLLDSVYMLLGKPYGSHQNVYAIDFERSNELVLIDTGLDDADLRMIERNIESFGLSGRTIKDIFITHCHFDHAGNAEKFRKKGARIHIGSEDAEPILSGNDRAIGFAYGIAFPKVGSVETVSDEEVFEFDGMTVTALHTPGHSRGFMCYELKTGDKTILFSASAQLPLPVFQSQNLDAGAYVEALVLQLAAIGPVLVETREESKRLLHEQVGGGAVEIIGCQ